MALTDCDKCGMAEEYCKCNQIPNISYIQKYNELNSICLGIYYARISMREDLVKKGLEQIDRFFREPNMN